MDSLRFFRRAWFRRLLLFVLLHFIMATGQYKLKDHVLELLEWTSKKTGTSNSIDTGECGKDADTRPTTVTEAQRRLDRIHKAWEEIVKNGDDSPFDAPTQKLLFKSLYNIAKAYRLYKRSDPNWAGPLESIEALRRQLVVTRAPLKDATATSSSSSSSKASSDPAGSSSSDSSPRKTGLPTSIHEYRTRLIQQKKDLYKDPPALPPSAVVVQHQMYPLIQLYKSDKTYRFEPGAESDAPTREFIRQFRPNVSPGQVLRGGAFGGTYFRSIHSAVTNQRYTSQDVVRDTLPSEWIQGLDAKRYLTSSTYRTEINKFGVKCGGSLGMWEVRCKPWNDSVSSKEDWSSRLCSVPPASCPTTHPMHFFF